MAKLLFESPEQQFLSELNTKNISTLPRLMTFSDIEIYGTEEQDNSSGWRVVKIRALPSSQFYGKVELPGIGYTRYLWSRLFKQIPVLQVSDGVSTKDILNKFCEVYGIPPFTYHPTDAGEIENNHFDFAPGLDTDTFRFSENDEENVCEVSFQPQSLGYIGMIKIKLINNALDLNEAVKQRVLSAMAYPDGIEGPVGSLSILTTPVRYKFDKKHIDFFTKVGGKLMSNAEVMDAIAEQTAAFYGNATLINEIKGAIKNYSLTETNIDVSGTAGQTAIPTAVFNGESDGNNWTGKVILNDVKFV